MVWQKNIDLLETQQPKSLIVLRDGIWKATNELLN